jgi:hypothetical protein
MKPFLWYSLILWMFFSFFQRTSIVQADDSIQLNLPEEKAQRIRELLEKLSSDRFADREKATQELIRLPEAKLFIEKNLQSDDPDLISQSQRVLEGMEKWMLYRRLNRYLAYDNKGGD